jgi:hypothetical protein
MRTEPRILLSCVCENEKGFHERVLLLLATARSLGGRLAHSLIVVNVVGAPDAGFVRSIERLGAELRIVPGPGAGRPPHANKLRMLELAGREDFDVLLAVDCDIAVARDPTPLISSEAISVVPADTDPLHTAQWRELLATLEIAPRQRSVRATTTGRPMPPYFNSGVVAVPRGLCAPLLSSWSAALDEVSELWLRDAKVIPRSKRFFADQYALMAALLRDGLPWSAASRELNFPTHVSLNAGLVRGLRPALLHYHEEFDHRGFLFRPRCAVANAAADHVNRCHRDSAGVAYAGLRPRPLHSHANVRLRRLGQRGRAAQRKARRRVGIGA